MARQADFILTLEGEHQGGQAKDFLDRMDKIYKIRSSDGECLVS